MQWHNKPFAELDADELRAAVNFYEKVLAEIQHQTHISVWGFFAARRTELILLQTKRLAAA